ncbi:uncharacterized protein MELLADRAFT_118060 [Melampsora larici-populina 98AG31]|uniref:RecF/RecN/SMC N-terminal domain-containing protein n=1 Tax=Melampsora larici-populina (strain 98AG31 / pathotype 3-4-7) TaxID=747676 RepID=F4S4R6_MELLP|nr:uncharacterized protein MELLADRAFT_118060 [Melampsora larici-populina 98AG31]EGG00382.1 hypothetical protein MELLADRAFT_118060 [Melampsora larici-populina 98AG31]
MGKKHHAPDDDESPTSRKRARVDKPREDAFDGGILDGESEFEYECDKAEEEALRQGAKEMAMRAPRTGAIRKAGAIEQLEVFNFMCHDYLSMDFSPQANFIIGNNGSGKSAILTGIMLALGGKASTTSRATSLKGFIQHHKSRAEIKLQMSNCGEEAYRPDVYGEAIIIERAITKDGGGGYKIKSGRDNKVISTHRSELQDILDHFMIQADNPLNVLSQNAAKDFLTKSTSKDKYGLFMRGTQLQQLTEEYGEIENNITTAKVILTNKKQAMSLIHDKAKRARAIMKDVEQAFQDGSKKRCLQKELAWAYVSEAEAQQAQLAEAVQEEEIIIPQCEVEVNNAEIALAEAKQEITTLNSKMSVANDDQLQQKCTELKTDLKKRHGELKKLNNDLRDSDTAIKKFRKDLETQQVQIDAENAKASRTTATTRQDAINRRDECENEIKVKESEIDAGQRRIAELNDDLQQSKADSDKFKGEVEGLKSDLDRLSNDLNRAVSAQADRFCAFGRNAKNVMEQIAASRWNEKPLGPIGLYVQCEDKAWSQLLETVLNRTLGSFVVTNRDDENQLRHILKSHQWRNPIIRSKPDLFDFSAGEPDEQYRTILRMLQFKNEFVKRVLINEDKIERTILVNHRREGDPIMSRHPRDRKGIERCFTIDGYRVGGITGGKQVSALSLYQGTPRLRSGDVREHINQKHEEIQERTAQKQQAEIALRQALKDCSQTSNLIADLNHQRVSTMTEISKLKARKAQLDDELTETFSSNLAVLESMKNDLQKAIDTSVAQFGQLTRKNKELRDDMRPILEEKEKIDAYFASQKDAEAAIHVGSVLYAQILAATETEMTCKAKVTHYKSSLLKHQQKLEQINAQYQEAIQNTRTITEQAIELCGSPEVVPSSKTVKKLISEIEKISSTVKSTETRYGGKSLETIQADCQEATIAWKKADTAHTELRGIIILLKHALKLRKNKWLQFRCHISVRARMKFINHLNNRGYTGKLNFDHHHQKLEVHVDTQSEQLNQAKLRDPGGLSGGERSFSTISLLLTLWDAVNCPIRCLDEFDVFMDPQHRRVAVDMMVQSAKEAHEVQYMFVTPQELPYTMFGPETKIVRMADPKKHKS